MERWFQIYCMSLTESSRIIRTLRIEEKNKTILGSNKKLLLIKSVLISFPSLCQSFPTISQH